MVSSYNVLLNNIRNFQGSVSRQNLDRESRQDTTRAEINSLNPTIPNDHAKVSGKASITHGVGRVENHETFASNRRIAKSNSESTSSDSNSSALFEVVGLKEFFKQFEKQTDNIITKQTLELYADPHVTQAEVQRMVDQTEDILDIVAENFKSMMKLLYKNIAIDRRVDSAVQKYLSIIFKVVQKHDTHYKRLAMMTRDGLNHPEPLTIGSCVEEKCINSQIVKELTPMEIYYNPLEGTFKAFFERPGVSKAVIKYMNELNRNTTVLSNFIQGEYWRGKMRKYFIGKIVIPLLLYIEDFEVNNPLGSHKGIQKLCRIYCSILGLPTEFRSKLENILLVMLFHASDRKNFGYSHILSRLVDELDELSRDDCVKSRIYTRTDLGERKENLRLPVNYGKDLGEGSSESGLKEYCKLNDVEGYHSCNNPFCDILHDISKGGLKFALVEILFHFICGGKTLDLDIFNDRMKSFNYTGNGFSNNKPPPFQ
ncbi:hypothetical protein QAD02_003571 [Eretmocerus hayati]|uniref:Uncharacterized protein n=1 Tax=Eretmocerus hayati TaxID=131215 RepID=A0ACC2NPZ8_9HYME|nr:hypothetical protein QAD02_003571 [Eretmocerus hayati]